MFSAILDVALGIILLFLILSLIASAVNEIISARFQSRARTMEFFLSCLLYESVEAPLTTYRIVWQRLKERIDKWRGKKPPVETPDTRREMVENFVNAPLLFAQLGDRKMPNYIKAEDFAQAVFDFVRDQYKRTQILPQQAALKAATAEMAAIAQQQPTQQPPIASAPQQPPIQPTLPATDPNQGQAAGGGGTPGGDTLPAPSTQPIEAIPSDDAFDFASLSDAVTALPPDMPLKRVLASIILRVKEDVVPENRRVDNVRIALQKWYDNSMDRVSGWYKRDVQINLAVIGIIIVLVLNVDTLAVANRLLENPALREAVSARAQTIAQQVSAQPVLAALVAGGTTISGAVVPTAAPVLLPTATALAGVPTSVVPTPTAEGPAAAAGVVTPLPPAPQQPTSANVATVNQYIGSLVSLQGQINALDVPIGWGTVVDYPAQSQPFSDFVTWWFKKIIGLIVTVLAIIQGAPFWFDLLNRVTNLRLTGAPPDKANNAVG